MSLKWLKIITDVDANQYLLIDKLIDLSLHLYIFLKDFNKSNKKVEVSNNDKGKPKLWDSSKNKLCEWVAFIFSRGIKLL